MTEAPTATRIRPKDRDAILQSLRAGVVPRTGLQHIAVGRPDEIGSLMKDIARIADGGTGCRFVIGDYGSGKTFFLQLIRSIALQKNLLSVHADLAPDRRLQATGGQARSLFAELMRNIATRGQQDGGAMTNVVEKFVGTAMSEARRDGTDPETAIRAKLSAVSELVGGYDFADVIAAYWRGHESGKEQLRADAVRWLRGEFSTRTDARTALGVRSIVDDSQFYDQLKLMARFARLAGFSGLLVCLDEMVNLYKLANSRPAVPTTSRSCASSTTACRAAPSTSDSSSAAPPTSSWTPAAACTPTRPCRAGSPRTRSPSTGSRTSPAPSSGWPPSPRRTSSSC
jgi:hypothetical protein